MLFGEIENTNIGDIFKDRKELAEAGIHNPPMAGIEGRESEGACSIVLSGGYEDDEDYLDFIVYTGQGGQDKPGGKQVKDQEFKRGNKALQVSMEYNLPVRVSRGFQVLNGPEFGYRYDGLYYVKKAYYDKGSSGYRICRFHLESENKIESLERKVRANVKKNYITPDRVKRDSYQIKRNPKLAENIKDTYDFKCQVCGVYLDSPKNPIAIGAHIKGLGKPDDGPDVIENMLCLCPNHHDQFDKFSFYIEPKTLIVRGIKDYEGKALTIKHEIDNEFLEYRYKKFLENN